MTDVAWDERLPGAVFDHLDRLVAGNPAGTVHSRDINAFAFEGRSMPLVVQSGIWKPAGLDAALTIRTTYTPPDAVPPYADALGDEGLIRYKYRGTDPRHADNRALRAAMQRGAPLAYFVGVERGVYLARYPVWVRAEDPTRHEFAVAVDEAQRDIDLAAVPEAQRAYLRRLTSLRLHQPLFRARVLRAYADTCAMCRLRHAELLDAAHILPDGHPRGLPVVPNGLALCKIHHAAYDRNILGVRPDLVVEVQPRVLHEIDGPMLRHGLQEMDGVRLLVPRSRREQPDHDRLEERYTVFRAAG
ncbi:MAG TPA: HNH endonuclease [Mycobacteriales bacterium]|nr:HNH endonuclease [Mycobacteriales bacterium]